MITRINILADNTLPPPTLDWFLLLAEDSRVVNFVLVLDHYSSVCPEVTLQASSQNSLLQSAPDSSIYRDHHMQFQTPSRHVSCGLD